MVNWKRASRVRLTLEHIIWVDEESLSVLSDMLSVLVPVESLPHVQGIFPVFGHSGRVVRVVLNHRSISRVAHAFVHLDGIFVALSDKEIHKPGFLLIARLFQRLTQKFAVA